MKLEFIEKCIYLFAGATMRCNNLNLVGIKIYDLKLVLVFHCNLVYFLNHEIN